MAARTVPIRLSRLLCPDLTPATKLVWLALQVDRHLKRQELRSPSRIRRRVGASRTTIRKAFVRLREPCRPQVPDDLVGLTRMQVRVNTELITDKSVPTLARVLYCVLLGLHRMKRLDILSSYASIAKVVRLQPRTVRRAVQSLAEAGWLAIAQKNKRAPIRFSFPDPKAARRRAEVRRAQQRLGKSEFVGETLALLWCDSLVASRHYMDDCYPEFLINPETNELLQADRYYLDHNVVIEFNGPQHDGRTEHFSEVEARAQIARDRIKKETCKRHGIPLITLRPEDLTFQRMRELLGRVLPLREVGEDEPVISYLETVSKQYLKSIQRIRRQSGQRASSA